ncbi:hypothetical protein IV454_00825 [Massilia antarctica]|uniref:Uncharacterized protein n=1 Tax=Massilia antarctica TaxID=2765360 RepID=A0AA48WEN4_9BURK|nr:hypothetical protein [Massilia antarctica]QPI50219.1 hypothetical protein IV454_00825 [Massilia antarctica]
MYSPSEKITLARTHERSFELVDVKGERGLLALSATSSNIARLVGQIAFGFPIALGDMLVIVMVLPYLGSPFQVLFNEGIETARRVPRMAATPAPTDRSAALSNGSAQGAPGQPP